MKFTRQDFCGARNARGYNMDDVVRLTGLHRNTIQRYESGGPTSAETMRKLEALYSEWMDNPETPIETLLADVASYLEDTARYLRSEAWSIDDKLHRVNRLTVEFAKLRDSLGLSCDESTNGQD